MKRFLLVPAFGVLVLASSAPASAQSGWPDYSRPSYRYEPRQPYYQPGRVAYDNGYREGIREGEKDGRRRDAFNFRDEGAWRDADKGYRRTYGDRGRYGQLFRDGFEAGYADGYRRHGAYPGYGNGRYGNGRAVPRRPPASYPTYPNRAPGAYGYPGNRGFAYNAAYANGLKDGYEKGREDGRDRDRYDPARHKWYREGDRDYEREYGSREQYARVYRQAFSDGYDRGYREAVYRR
jgi:hypothetical protein